MPKDWAVRILKVTRPLPQISISDHESNLSTWKMSLSVTYGIF